jgi:DNA-binding CsgD family transcriptional regulator
MKPTEVVGRATELAKFPPFLDAVLDGPAALVLEGDAGIGKTALWFAGAALARERGYHLLSCRPAEAETQLPFAALGDLLDTIPESALASLAEPRRRALAVAMLRADWDGPAIGHRAVSLAVLGVLRVLAAEGPVILAVDDLQWLDLPSAAVLQFALRRIETERIGLLATRRGRGDEIPFGLAQTAPADRLQLVEVGPLDRDSLGRLLLDRLELALARPALLQVQRVSAGNPFLALEIARALKRREVRLTPGEPFPVPRNLRELVRDRLEHLPPSARETGLVVAALPQPTVERVEAAADADGLAQALAAGIVEIEGERIRFTHPLLGSILYSEASTTRRRELHARLATLTGDVEERAGHLAVAATGPDSEVADILDAAASRALGRGAPDAAADFLERAAGLTPPEDRGARCRRGLEAAECRFEAGDTAGARSLFAEAAEISPPGADRAHALTRVGAMRAWQIDLHGAVETYREALSNAGEDPVLVAAIEQDLAWTSWFQGDRFGTASHLLRTAELARAVGDQARMVHALAGLALCEARRSSDEAITLIERALELDRSLEDARIERPVRQGRLWETPSWVKALFLAGDGDLDSARAIYAAEYERAVERGNEAFLPNLFEHLSLVERRAGNWDLAESHARNSYEIAVRSDLVSTYHSTAWAWIQALRGHFEAARELAATGMTEADRLGIGALFGGHRAVLGLIELSLGDPRGALEYLEPLAEQLTPGIPENGWFRFLADAIEACVALGEIEEAQILLDRLAERRMVLLDRAWVRAALPRCRGLVFASVGDEAGAGEAFALALAEHEHLPEPFELARTLLALGRTQRRFRHRGTARESLLRARAIFSELGAPLWQARTDEELHRIGGRAPRGGGLTPTEERIAELAADGLTNREIAAALFVSVNTVQAYLKRIYRELGIRSRTELARSFPPGARANSTDSGVSYPPSRS